MNLDFRQASYEELVTFVFDHYPEEDVDSKWYWQLDGDVQIDPSQAVAFLTRLCIGCFALIEQFTPPQIAEGLNYVFGAGGGFEFYKQLWNPAVPWPERRAGILAIPSLYTNIFERIPDGIEECAFMLWDSIAYDYCCGNCNPMTNAEDARVQDTMFEALTSMLRSEHPQTIRGALHGLGHLEHRAGDQAIRALLASSRSLDPEVRAYGTDILEGNFQ